MVPGNTSRVPSTLNQALSHGFSDSPAWVITDHQHQAFSTNRLKGSSESMSEFNPQKRSPEPNPRDFSRRFPGWHISSPAISVSQATTNDPEGGPKIITTVPLFRASLRRRRLQRRCWIPLAFHALISWPWYRNKQASGAQSSAPHPWAMKRHSC